MNYPVNDQTLTMTRREIAEVTGKEHKNVKRDIENMLNELNEDALTFERIYIESHFHSGYGYLLFSSSFIDLLHSSSKCFIATGSIGVTIIPL